ncbi:MAG TPA: histidine phosphatase family protein [Roseiflexaceae bacterium]|nr:histidine phosphatase family protein [Roseiflexaceae bacterium]
MQTDLYLIRHGQTATNQARVIQGWDAEPLNARGRWQAEQAGQRLAEAGLAALYASPLRRASETAEIIGRVARLDISLIEDLREMNTGRASGLHGTQFMVRHPRLWWAWLRDDADLAFPGGDTLSVFYERSAGAIGSLVQQHAGQAIAVVAHGGVISGYLSLLIKGRGSNRFALRLRNGAITHLRWHGRAALQLLAFNDTRHLRKQTALDQRPSGQ